VEIGYRNRDLQAFLLTSQEYLVYIIWLYQIYQCFKLKVTMAQADNHCFSLWRPGFYPRVVYAEWVVDKVTMEQVSP
jgi:hypothetical protein